MKYPAHPPLLPPKGAPSHPLLEPAGKALLKALEGGGVVGVAGGPFTSVLHVQHPRRVFKSLGLTARNRFTLGYLLGYLSPSTLHTQSKKMAGPRRLKY